MGNGNSTRTAVALNGRFSGTPKPTGTQTAVFHLFNALVRAHERRIPLAVFADRRFPGVADWENFPGTVLCDVPFQSWSRGRAHLWEQFEMSAAARKLGCRVAHHPMTTNPRWSRGLKSVVTVHDLNFLRHPEWFSASFRLVYRLCALAGLRHADAVVAISDYVLADIRERLKVPEEKLRRVYNGVKFTAASPAPATSAEPYIFCVGSLQPHKNLPRIIRAFRQLKPEFPTLELRVAGRPQARFQAMPELEALLETPGVRVFGYLSDEELHAAYAGTAVFCFPSLEEGFGLPVLEAMAAGAPVVTSNCSCLPEIAGNAAELVDPLNEESIAGGLRRLLTLPSDERSRWVAAGRAQAGRFSWDMAAAHYLELYGRLLGTETK